MTSPEVPLYSETELDHAFNKRCDALYKAELSALYHQKRERFFELADKLGKAASLIGGSAALWKLSNGDVVAVMAACVTVSSALSLVFSFSERSKRHAELAQGFRLIISEVLAKSEFDVTPVDAGSWMSRVCALEAKEPPSLSALTVMCQNELAIARGADNKVRPQDIKTRMLAHFFDMPLSASPGQTELNGSPQ
ncbi:hypothetical protein GJ697_13530 [Pseudoduganella sp. FT25W]|uniref:SLATT domain-containing protein n=1 Tax=Duganella alba TaxID=2666081 RepID=A0A6L5QH63_9BURK|nr:hypothetical protein [Duganella alba]MRX08858.1 hypothetical protein [Duganella alba]MRX18848.1 hypothetical protein [Duganella alba]